MGRCSAPQVFGKIAYRRGGDRNSHVEAHLDGRGVGGYAASVRGAAPRACCSWPVMSLVAADSRTAGRWYDRADPKAVVP